MSKKLGNWFDLKAEQVFKSTRSATIRDVFTKGYLKRFNQTKLQWPWKDWSTCKCTHCNRVKYVLLALVLIPTSNTKIHPASLPETKVKISLMPTGYMIRDKEQASQMNGTIFQKFLYGAFYSFLHQDCWHHLNSPTFTTIVRLCSGETPKMHRSLAISQRGLWNHPQTLHLQEKRLKWCSR